MKRLSELDGIREGDTVTVNTDRLPEDRGRHGVVLYAYPAQPEFGNPAEFIVAVDGVARPLEREEFTTHDLH